MKYEEWFKILFENSEFITTDKYLFNQSKNEYLYAKTDYLYRFGRWRGVMQSPLLVRQLKNFRRVAVLGHSDIPVLKRDLRFLNHLGFKKIFGVNTLNHAGFSESIPIGITNNCGDSPLHSILGNTDHFNVAHQNSKLIDVFNGSIYINFTISNNAPQRNSLLEVLKEVEDVKYGDFEMSEVGRIHFLQNLRTHSLIPAPAGNGFDTHRLWETLYMGGTPVIRACNYLPKIIEKLPIVVLEEWIELKDSNRLEEKWTNAQLKRENWEYLTSAFWVTRIINSLEEVHADARITE